MKKSKKSKKALALALSVSMSVGALNQIPAYAATNTVITKENNNKITVYYKHNTWSTAYVKYKVDGKKWTTKKMKKSSSQEGYTWKYTISLKNEEKIIMCFTNGSGKWDNNKKNNYTIKGIKDEVSYGIKGSKVKKLEDQIVIATSTPYVIEEPDETESPVIEETAAPQTTEPTIVETAKPTIKPTVKPTRKPTASPIVIQATDVPATETPTTELPEVTVEPTATPENTVVTVMPEETEIITTPAVATVTPVVATTPAIVTTPAVTETVKPTSTPEVEYTEKALEIDGATFNKAMALLGDTDEAKHYTYADLMDDEVVAQNENEVRRNIHSIRFSSFPITSGDHNISVELKEDGSIIAARGLAESAEDGVVYIYAQNADYLVLPEDASGMFENLGLSDYGFVKKLDFRNCKNTSQMFFGCGDEDSSSLIFGDRFDTNNIEKMDRMFMFTYADRIELGDGFVAEDETSLTCIFFATATNELVFQNTEVMNCLAKRGELNSLYMKYTAKDFEGTIAASRMSGKNLNVALRSVMQQEPGTKEVYCDRLLDTEIVQQEDDTVEQIVFTNEAPTDEDAQGYLTYTHSIILYTKTEEPGVVYLYTDADYIGLPDDCSYAFANLCALKDTDFVSHLYLGGVKNTEGMFENCGGVMMSCK